MIEVGDKLSFKPMSFLERVSENQTQFFGAVITVTGTVERIHAEHGWYRVRYEVNGITQYECFHFAPEQDEADGR